MNGIGAVLVMATVVYAVRLGGLLHAGRSLPAAWVRVLHLVPVATLTALVTISLAGRPEEAGLRLPAAVVAAVVAYRTGRAWLCIVAGMTSYWLLRLV
jgi:branched-subunit amino acid transport protein